MQRPLHSLQKQKFHNEPKFLDISIFEENIALQLVMKRAHIKTFIKLAFFVAFLYFSAEAVKDFIIGDTVFENINYLNKTLIFPSLTLCPRQRYFTCIA